MKKMTHNQWLYNQVVELLYEDFRRTMTIELRFATGKITAEERDKLIDDLPALEIGDIYCKRNKNSV